MINQKESAASVPSGVTFSGLLGVLKLPLLFAPFVFLRGCGGGQYPAYTIFYFMALPVFWPFILVPLAILIAILLFKLRQRSTGFALRTKLGLTMSALSLLGLVWTGWRLTCPSSPGGNSAGNLLWGFWALLACDMGMISGYAHDLGQFPKQPPFNASK